MNERQLQSFIEIVRRCIEKDLKIRRIWMGGRQPSKSLIISILPNDLTIIGFVIEDDGSVDTVGPAEHAFTGIGKES